MKSLTRAAACEHTAAHKIGLPHKTITELGESDVSE